MFSLPFGASSSVFAFTRLALGLNRAGCMIFKFLWSNYLDDYAVFSNSALQKACETTVNAFFHVLGIRTSRSDEKCVSFAEVFGCLGITFLLHKTPGELFIQNTSKRCIELCKMVTDILLADSLSFKESQSLRSRLFFAEQHLFGRIGMATLKSLRVYESVNLLQPIPQHLRSMLSAMRLRLADNQPRPVPLLPRKTWHVFTDGAQEDYTSIGGILTDSYGAPQSFFCAMLPESVTRLWPQHHVLHCELLPVLFALLAWDSTLKNCNVFFHLDSEAARHCLIKATCAQKQAQEIMNAFMIFESQAAITPWFSRLCSKSNPTDAPSRLDFSTNSTQCPQVVVSDHALSELLHAVHSSEPLAS